MKTKIVLWGTNDQDERVLVALELRPKDNKVDVYEFPEMVATEAFYQQLMQEWRNGQEVAFPENGFSKQERELTITESILPENLKVERGDLIQRAQAEWHFVVLSSKLSDAYHSELAEIKDKIDRLDDFDNEAWNTLKDFWDKVQSQVRERNLFRDHANNLRDKTNELFAKMKELRSKLDEQYKESSKANLERFMNKLNEVEEKIKGGLRFQNIFNELKDIQRKFRGADLTREHRAKVWERIDGAFKTVKEKRFGSSGGGDDKSPVERIQRRYDGLMAAMGKMKRSIERDEEELEFQNRRISTTHGQLEAQIRQAKIVMIEERIRSKEEKLKEMLRTKEELEKRMESAKAKEAKRKEKEKIEEAKRLAQQKIAEEIKEAAEARVDDAEKLEKAAEALASKKVKATETKPKEAPKVAETKQPSSPADESMLDAVGATLGEVVEDAVDTFKAIATVVGGQIGEALEDLKEKATEVKEDLEDRVSEMQEDLKEKVADAKEDLAEMQEDLKGKVADAKEDLTEMKENLQGKAADVKADLSEKIDEVMDKVTDEEE